ncbi:hypothetical protein ACFSHT_22215 [Paraburkholderia silviterrae]|uniref:Uncharacterized protein n=1 Tax=Paraburkholderia silviterrae TaxID=2528715 RepID=A0A4R5MFT5_9BURK|nr:hypothetical protein [Paraburkholderia silviterrae]TDG25897.1 hypothetical protein EYW47_00565 [Paraburkholderia silviterrae]
MAFEYERQLTKLLHVNLRTEKHGDQEVPAIDLRFRYTASNNSLVMFSPTLKSSLFEKEDSPQKQINPDPDHLTVVKNPKMGPVRWDETYECARVVIHIGASGKEDVVLNDCKVNKWLIEVKAGGTVIYEYRVQANANEKEIAKIAGLLNHEIFVTLDPEGGEAEEEKPDTGKGANEIAEELRAARSRGGRGRRQLSMVE